MPGSLKDEAVARAIAGAIVAFPPTGALRVHPNSASVYRPTPAARGRSQRRGPNRFDDPHHHYPVRYLGANLRVCLLEVLARFRADLAADQVLEAMSPGLDDPALADLVDPAQAAGIEGFLAVNQVAVFIATPRAPLSALVDVFDPALLAALDGHHRIRAQLDRPEVIAAHGAGSATVHLDGALIRNANKVVGRPITQEISRLLIDILGVQGLRYSSRHSEGDEAICWAIHGDVPLRVDSVQPMDPRDDHHRGAVHDVARLWDLPLPPRWAPAP